MELAERKKRSQTSRWLLSAAAVSALTAAAALLLLQGELSEAAHSQRTAATLKALTSRDVSSATALVTLSLTPPRITDLAAPSATDSRLIGGAAEQLIALVPQLASLPPQSLPGRIAGIIAELKRASQPDRLTQVFQILATTQLAAEDYTKSHAVAATTSARLRQLQDDAQRLRTQEELLRKDYSELFNLPLDGELFERYSAGVLAALPPLKGVPDGASDLETLRGYLASAGGAVKLTGENAAADFATKIANLRAVASATASESSEQEELQTEVEARIEDAQRRIAAQSRRLEQLIFQGITMISEDLGPRHTTFARLLG